MATDTTETPGSWRGNVCHSPPTLATGVVGRVLFPPIFEFPPNRKSFGCWVPRNDRHLPDLPWVQQLKGEETLVQLRKHGPQRTGGPKSGARCPEPEKVRLSVVSGDGENSIIRRSLVT